MSDHTQDPGFPHTEATSTTSPIWKRDSTTEGDKLFTQINGEWLELKPISPEDIKVLKEALEYHESLKLPNRLRIWNSLKEETDFHTRTAEALRRVVG